MSQMPVFIAECPGVSETALEKVLSKLVSSKTIAPTVAEKAKSEYHKFVTRTIRDRKSDFLNFDKKVQRLDQFLISCFSGTKGFTELCEVFKVLLILSHGQAQVECVFRTNAKILMENQNTESLMAQIIINDHMRFHKHNYTLSKSLLENHVK